MSDEDGIVGPDIAAIEEEIGPDHFEKFKDIGVISS